MAPEAVCFQIMTSWFLSAEGGGVSFGVSGTGGNNIGGLGGDDGTGGGVGNQSVGVAGVESSGISHGVDSSSGSGVGGLGGKDSGLINGDNGAIVVSYQGVGVSSGISQGVSGISIGVHGVDGTSGGQVSGTGD